MKKPSAVQLVLSGLGIVSAFLPWLSYNIEWFTFSASLMDLMNGAFISEVATLFILLGGPFLIGSLAILVWRKAYLVQLVGMISMTILVVFAMTKDAPDVSYFFDRLSALIGMTSVGVWMAWASAIGGLILLGPAKLRAPFERLPFIGPTVTKCSSDVSPRPRYEARAPTRARPSAVSYQEDHQAAIASGERYLAANDLPAALRSFGRALGASKSDQETAISKVKIAVVLDLMGREFEAARFMQEAEDLYPAASFIFQNGQRKPYISG